MTSAQKTLTCIKKLILFKIQYLSLPSAYSLHLLWYKYCTRTLTSFSILNRWHRFGFQEKSISLPRWTIYASLVNIKQVITYIQDLLKNSWPASELDSEIIAKPPRPPNLCQCQWENKGWTCNKNNYALIETNH